MLAERLYCPVLTAKRVYYPVLGIGARALYTLWLSAVYKQRVLNLKIETKYNRKNNAKQKHKNTKKNKKKGQIGFNLKKLNNATV